MRTDPLHDDAYPLFLKSLIAVLIAVIVVFYCFPDFPQKPPTSPKYFQEPMITLQDLPPRTIQRLPQKRPQRILPSLFIPIPVEDEELPEPLEVAESGQPTNQLGEASPARVVEIPPRPLLEIYPDTGELTCKGEIVLFIFVTQTGKVQDIQVLKNTTNSSQCLQRTIQAVRQTRWLPGRQNGQPADMWVKKTFRFQ